MYLSPNETSTTYLSPRHQAKSGSSMIIKSLIIAYDAKAPQLAPHSSACDTSDNHLFLYFLVPPPPPPTPCPPFSQPGAYLARIARHLEQEEARVVLRQKVVRRLVIVQGCSTESLPQKSAMVRDSLVRPQTKRRNRERSRVLSSCMASQNQATSGEQASTPGGHGRGGVRRR